MSAPSVYAAINAVSAELAKAGIAKSHINQADDYQYRSIDDLLDRLAPLLAEKKLCVLPRVLERSVTERRDDGQHLLFHVCLRVAFTLTSVDDGSSHSVEAYGEALDPSDKATAKAMSAAYKSAMIQTFCIPLSGSEDPERSSPQATTRVHEAEPVQGWEQWARDIEDIVGLCESENAIDLVQERNRQLLKALSRERPDLYHQLGDCFGARRDVLRARTATVKPRKRRSKQAEPNSNAALLDRGKHDTATSREKEHA
ncbi:MAG: ERF family protein [Sphingomicrobium sp.]